MCKNAQYINSFNDLLFSLKQINSDCLFAHYTVNVYISLKYNEIFVNIRLHPTVPDVIIFA